MGLALASVLLKPDMEGLESFASLGFILFHFLDMFLGLGDLRSWVSEND